MTVDICPALQVLTAIVPHCSPDILRQLYAIEVSAHSHPWSMEGIARCFAPGQTVMTVTCNACQTGFAAFRVVCDEAELLTIGVLREMQGQGLGRVLLSAVLREMHMQGALHCFLEVSTSNAAAIHLYRTLGFAVTGLRPGYYPGPAAGSRQDAWTMHAALPRSQRAD